MCSVYVGVWVTEGSVYECVCTWVWSAEGDACCLPWLFCTRFLETESLTQPGAYHLG